MINPPTDNLYKFCAILGLILTVFNSYYNFEMLTKTGHDLIILKGEEKKHLYELKLHEKKATEFKKELEIAVKFDQNYLKKQQSLLNAVNDKKPNIKQLENLKFDVEVDKEFYLKNEKKIDSLNNIYSQEFESLIFKQIEIDTKRELINQDNNKSDMYSGYLFAGTILGLLLTGFGFFNWIKIQIFIDKDLYKIK